MSTGSSTLEMFEALCISGGGTKGFAALGVLQFLQDTKRIDVGRVKYMSGCSIGAAICFLLAIGYSPVEIMVYICTHQVFESVKLKKLNQIFTGEGIYDHTGMQSHFESMCLAKINYLPTLKQLFDKTDVELILCSYNYSKRKAVYFSYKTHPDLDCIQAVLMSTNLPFLFRPMFLDGDEYMDGGVIDNFPLKQLPYSEKATVGIYLDDGQTIAKEESQNKILAIGEKIINIISIPRYQVQEFLLAELNRIAKIIHLHVENTPIYRFDLKPSERLELFSYGYNFSKSVFEQGSELQVPSIDEAKE